MVKAFASAYADAVSIGIGGVASHLPVLYRSYNEARSALRYCQARTTHPFVFFGDVNTHAAQSDAKVQKEIDALYDAISHQDIDQSQQLLNCLTEYVCAQDELPLHLCYDVVISMLRSAKKHPVMAQALQSSPEFTHDHIEFVDSYDFKEFVDALFQIITSQLEVDDSRFNQACMLVQQHLLDPTFCQEELAECMGLSLSALSRIFREHTDKTPAAYILSMRQEYAKHQLIATNITISALAAQLGYSQPSSFIRTFKREEGITPGEYRQQRNPHPDNN